MIRKLKDAKWWLLHRVHPRHRYHVVKTGLTPNYYDEDTLILHSCMAMLCRYVEWHGTEQEMEAFNAELRDPKADPYSPRELLSRQADKQEEALNIYRWWKYQKPADDKKLDEMISNLYGQDCVILPELRKEYASQIMSFEEKIEKDEQTMLHRLINIRKGLWT